MPTTSNTQYNTQRLKTMAAVQTFKKQYSFKACIAAVADPGKGLGGPAPPLFFYRNEARRTQNNFLERALPLSQGQLTAEKKILGVRPPPSSQGLMTTPLPPFSESLDPPLCSN